MRLTQKLANNKNLQFLSNPANILAIFPIHELIIFSQFHNDWIKIVDFYFWLIYGPVSFFSYKSLNGWSRNLTYLNSSNDVGKFV